MKATNALPTEDRIQRMNDQQWLWYYLNLKKDEEEEDLKWKERLDYLSWFINPDLAKSVMEIEKRKKQGKNSYVIENTNSYNQEMYEGDQSVNDSFEDELKKALQEAGMNEEGFTELPDSVNVGDPYESVDNFIDRVLAAESIANEFKPNKGKLPPGFDTEEEYLKFLQIIEEEENRKNNIDNEEFEIKENSKDVLEENNVDINDIDFFEYPEE